MTSALRDIADFYRFALKHSTSNRRLVELSDVVAWVDSLIVASDVPDDWMIEVSLAKTPDVAVFALAHVPPPATGHLGASILVAHLKQLWSSNVLSRDDVCHLLWNLQDELPPESKIAAIIPDRTLDDAEACFAQGIRDRNPFTHVDEALVEFFGLFDQFDELIPPVTVVRGG